MSYVDNGLHTPVTDTPPSNAYLTPAAGLAGKGKILGGLFVVAMIATAIAIATVSGDGPTEASSTKLSNEGNTQSGPGLAPPLPSDYPRCDCDTATINAHCDTELVWKQYDNGVETDSDSIFGYQNLFTKEVNVTYQTVFEFECTGAGAQSGFIASIELCGQTFSTSSDTNTTSEHSFHFYVDEAKSDPLDEPFVYTALGEGEWGTDVSSPPLDEFSSWVWDGNTTNKIVFGFHMTDMTCAPTTSPTNLPSVSPTIWPTRTPTDSPTPPTNQPSVSPTIWPTRTPTDSPSEPTIAPSRSPLPDGQTHSPSISPTIWPTRTPTGTPTGTPTRSPLPDGETHQPTSSPITPNPSTSPTYSPTWVPTKSPTPCTTRTWVPGTGFVNLPCAP